MSNLTSLVSVIITTQNRSSLLNRAIKSVLNQTYKNIEIIIVDDASSDDTKSLVKGYLSRYQQIKYKKNKQVMGANYSRNLGINIAQGEFVTGLDDDDEFLPTRIQDFVDEYREEYSYLFSDFNIIQKDKIIKRQFKKVITLDDMLYENCTGNQVFSRKKNFINAGYFDESMPSAQDYDMFTRMIMLKNKAKCTQKATINVYEDHMNNRITVSHKKWLGYFIYFKKYKNEMNRSQIKYHLFILKYLRKGKYSASIIKLLPLNKALPFAKGFIMKVIFK